MPANNIIFMDGFDQYNTISNVKDKYWSAVTPTSGISISSGRHSGNCLITTSQYDTFYKAFQDSQYICASFAFKMNGYVNAQRPFLQINETSTVQVDLRMNQNSTLTMSRNGTALTNGTSTLLVPLFLWNWLEIKLMISNSISASSCQVKINDILYIDLPAGQDTQNSANSYANVFSFPSPRVPFYLDDFILQTGVGSDFLGDTRIVTSLPNGSGSSSDFIGSDGNSIDNYLLVDDPTPDEESTYVESNVIGSKDIYTFPSIGTTGNSITALGVNVKCRKTDAGLKQLCSITKVGTTEYYGANVNMSDGSICQIQEIFPTNPDTGLTWSQSEAESAQFGQKLVS